MQRNSLPETAVGKAKIFCLIGQNDSWPRMYLTLPKQGFLSLENFAISCTRTGGAGACQRNPLHCLRVVNRRLRPCETFTPSSGV